MSDLVIETKKLTKIYGEQTAVNSVNLHVKPGRIYGLLGRNGAGKTTIMKMILGLTPITSGAKVFVNGKLITSNGYQVKEGDLISVRGLGKFRFEEAGKITKKNRISVTIQKYV